MMENDDRVLVSSGRRAKPSMANLNVYGPKESNGTDHQKKNRSSGNKQKDSDKPKDFFYREEVHELQSDNLIDDHTAVPYDEFSNGVEKIVMSDEDDEFINPVQVDTTDTEPVDTALDGFGNRQIKRQTESAAASMAMPDKTDMADDIVNSDAEDVLAGAINGNMHP